MKTSSLVFSYNVNWCLARWIKTSVNFYEICQIKGIAFYYKMSQLLQNVTFIAKCEQWLHFRILFIMILYYTKSDRYYYTMQQLFYWKIHQKFIVKCVTFSVRKCDSVMTKCNISYKLRWCNTIMCHQILIVSTWLKIAAVLCPEPLHVAVTFCFIFLQVEFCDSF